MTARVIRADYDSLSEMAGSFGQQAEQVRRTLQQLNREMDVLQSGDWLGRGAQAFYAEMNGQVLPTMSRLVRALEAAGDVTRQVNQIAQQAEKEASACFRLDGDGNGAGAAIGAAAAGLGAAGTSSGGEMDAVGGFPDGGSALWKPGNKGAGGRTASKKPGVTISAHSKQEADRYLGEIRKYNPKLAAAIEKHPGLRRKLEEATRAGYMVWASPTARTEFDDSARHIWINRDTTVTQFKTMADSAIDNPRILSDLDPAAVAAIKKNPVLLERVLDWGDSADPTNPTYLEMGKRPGDRGYKIGRNRTGTTITIDPKDPAGSLANQLDRVERGK